MKRIQYPNGFVGTASDKAAAILVKKPGHKIVGENKSSQNEEAKK